MYDADGNLTDDGRWLYTWEAQNRLIRMETTTAGHPYTKLTFRYDWQGRRLERAVWKGGAAASSSFSSRRRWLYDGWNPIAEFDSNEEGTTNTRLKTFTWGLDLSGTLQGAGGVGGLVVQTDVSGSVKRRASYDGNGNIVAWTRSNQSGPDYRCEYDAFGNTLVSEGTSPSEYGFSTKQQDAETGLYYYGYRYYDAVHGRWLNRDPIEEKGGLNLYGFVYNSPIIFIEVLGKDPPPYDPGNLPIAPHEIPDLTGLYPPPQSREKKGEFSGIIDSIRSKIPQNISGIVSFSQDIPVGTIGVASVNASWSFSGSVLYCTQLDGRKGIMAKGQFEMGLDAGVGTSAMNKTEPPKVDGKIGLSTECPICTSSLEGGKFGLELSFSAAAGIGVNATQSIGEYSVRDGLRFTYDEPMEYSLGTGAGASIQLLGKYSQQATLSLIK